MYQTTRTTWLTRFDNKEVTIFPYCFGCCRLLSIGLLLLSDCREMMPFVTKGCCLSQKLGITRKYPYFCRVKIVFRKWRKWWSFVRVAECRLLTRYSARMPMAAKTRNTACTATRTASSCRSAQWTKWLSIVLNWWSSERRVKFISTLPSRERRRPKVNLSVNLMMVQDCNWPEKRPSGRWRCSSHT